MLFIANGWKDYELIDVANGERLERWGEFFFVRPDPTAIWTGTSTQDWKKAHAFYTRSAKGGGAWDFKAKLPEKWKIGYKHLKFWAKPMNFKHMGIFPEQAANWDWLAKVVEPNMRVLNLFAYTGAATIAAAKAGAKLTHIDASCGIVQMAKDNAEINGLAEHPIRYIVDDCSKFVAREIRRNSQYDGIILDPPSYGRGPNGEVWKIEDELFDLLKLCKQVLSEKPRFVLINSYTTGISAATIKAMAEMIFKTKCESAELGIPVAKLGVELPSGCSCRVEF